MPVHASICTHDSDRINATAMEGKVSTVLNQHPGSCNGASALQQILTDYHADGAEESASDSAVDECVQMTIVGEEYGFDGTCSANCIGLNAVDDKKTQVFEGKTITSENLQKDLLVTEASDNEHKVDKDEKLQDTEEEILSDENLQDIGSDTTLKNGNLEFLEEDLGCSSQNALSNTEAELLDDKAHLLSKESLNDVQIESDGKRRMTAGSVNGPSTSGVNQRPRSIRNVNGSRKSAWGSTDVLQRVLSKGFEGNGGKKTLDSQRGFRQARKRRHDDMAYEGDMEWEALLGGAETTLDNNGTGEKDRLGKSRARAALGSILFAQVLTGESAAVTAGLRARAPGPAERIRFKDVLKRRGGLQEYLECRNLILGLWERDVQHILSVTDCGFSTTASLDETPRASLLREIYDFLNYHGYINVGIATKKLKSKTEARGVGAKSSKLKSEECQPEREREKVILAEADEEAALILGQIRGVEETVFEKPDSLSCEDKHQDLTTPEELQNAEPGILNGRKRGLEQGVEVMRPSKKGSGEVDVVPMDIDEKPLLKACRDSPTDHSLLGDLDKKMNVELRDSLSAQSTAEGSSLDMQDKDRLRGGSETQGESENLVLHCIQTELKGAVKVEQTKASDAVEELNELDSAKVLHDLRLCNPKSSKLRVEKVIKTENTTDSVTFHQEKQGGRKRIIIVGAGPAGLAAARHLQRMDFEVIVLEARQRVGGRVFTDRSSFSGPVDLGASIITGVEADVATERRPDPSALLCKQLNLELTTLKGECPLFDSVTGAKVPADIDGALEAEYNSLLDDTVMLVAQNGDVAMRMSLEEGLELVLKKQRASRVLYQKHAEPSLSSGTKGLSEKIAEGASLNKQGSLLSCNHFVDVPDIKQDINGTAAEIKQSALLVNRTVNTLSLDSPLAVANVDGENKLSPQTAGKISESDDLPGEQESLSQLERRVMDWHFANLEYGCAAELKKVSLPYWNQDDVYGGFGGPHCMIKGGYSTVMEALGEGLNIQLGQVVTDIDYCLKDGKSKGESRKRVNVRTEKGEVYLGEAVLVTVPLGCLKANTVQFLPPLPDWKTASIHRLGFGLLNKVVLEFPITFWDETVDYFGATAERTELRGRCFMFWNLKRTVGAPVLIALVVGKAAIEEENKEGSELVGHALSILRKLFGEAAVPDPTAFAVTKWGSDPFSRGAYSYVAAGASGEDYDILGRPVENCVFFAGEATCKEHPDTVGGAMMSGLREAVRIIDILENRGDSTAEAEAMAAAQRQSDSERNEVRDMVKRLTAAELSNAIRKDGGKLDGDEQPLSKAALLQDMFGNAKTTAGRLVLAKEMLQLPASSLKAFAGTKDGLTVLNTWILDSMGKDGTQLLRHCVRLLLVVATDLLSVRQSGVGRTVKEKVFVHTSRDIRAVASQLVKMWVEVFRKEKAAHGIAKPLKQSGGPLNHQSPANASKLKAKDQKVSSPNTGATILVSKDNASLPLVSDGDHMHASPEKQKQKQDSQNVQETISEGKNKDPSIQHADCGQEGQESEQGGPISDSEAAALAAAKAAEAAAVAAAEAYATAEAAKSTQPELPKILSFHKFAKREHMATRDESNRRKSLEREKFVLHGKQQVTSGVDARNCKVRNWSLDFSGSCSYLGSPSMLSVPDVGASNRDGLSLVAPNLPGLSNICTEKVRGEVSEAHFSKPEKQLSEKDATATRLKEAAENNNPGLCMNDAHARKGLGTSGMSSLNSGIVSLNSVPSVGIQKRNDSFPDRSTLLSPETTQGNGDFLTVSRPESLEGCKENLKGQEHIKKAVTEYVAQLLTPLYKTKRIQKDGFKSIVKKTTVKVMERSSEQEMAMEVSKFLDIKRKNKIRSLVDKFVERYLESAQR